MPRCSGLPAGYPQTVHRGQGQAGVEVGGFKIAGDPRVHGDYLRELAEGHESRLMGGLFSDSIPRGGAVVDAGAFLGHHTLIAAREVGIGGRVMAFERRPENYRALRANVRRNGYEDRVIALPLGVGAWSGRRTVGHGSADVSTSAMFVPERWTESTHTGALSLDSTVGGRPIDVVRLAIGGGEVQALRDMRRTLELSPDARLFVDCNPAALRSEGSSAESLLDELRDFGFRARVIEEGRGALVPAGPWLDEVPGRVKLMAEPASARQRLARRVLGPRRESPTSALV